MTRINTNVSALIAQQNLATANSQLQTALTRLSTGLQINSGADNPAGLIAAASLGSDITGVQTGINNSQLATEIISTADGGLSQVQQLLNTIQGLVNQSANTGALSSSQIAANQLQVDSSLQAIDTIASTTTFQGRALLDGSLGFINTSAGTSYTSVAATLAEAATKAVLTYGSGNTGLKLTAVTGGTAANHTRVVAATGSGTTTAQLTSYVSGGHTYNEISISFKTGATAADVIHALNATTAIAAVYTASVDSAGSATGSFAPVGAASATYGTGNTGFKLTALDVGPAANNTKIVAATGSGTTTAQLTSYVSGGHTYNEISISFKTAATAADVISALNATTAIAAVYVASVDSAGSAAGAFAPTIPAPKLSGGANQDLTGGIAGPSILISTVGGTTNYNGLSVILQSGATAGSETAAYSSTHNKLTVQIASGSSTTTAVANAISALSGDFSASVVTAGTLAGTTGAASLFTGSTSFSNVSNLQINQVNFGTQSSVGVDVQVKAQATQGSLTYSGGALTGNTVLQVGGESGYNVFNFDSGTTVAQIESAVNGVSDATGVAAKKDSSGNLVFYSTAYGSNAFVSVQAVSGTFNTVNGQAASSTRSTGTDVQATVNGVAATGNGLQASVDTPTLDLSFNVATGLTSGSSFNFSITGGGANFQIGPDVVSNEQARLGIQSVNTASLGGVDGSLYELQSGGDLSLSSNVGGAAKVVTEALNDITSLRGRLGAFQSTTLQTNIDTLQTTLTNLTSAQSNIQDADFAVETADLTRAQILVQAGTQVLTIANQNPQNVLKLLQSA